MGGWVDGETVGWMDVWMDGMMDELASERMKSDSSR